MSRDGHGGGKPFGDPPPPPQPGLEITPSARLASDWAIAERRLRNNGFSESSVALIREVFHFGALSTIDGVLDVSEPLAEALADASVPADELVRRLEKFSTGLTMIARDVHAALSAAMRGDAVLPLPRFGKPN